MIETRQRELLLLLRKRLRDVGYLSIGIALMGLFFRVRPIVVNMMVGTLDDKVAYFSSFLNGNRQLSLDTAFQALVDTPIDIIVGWFMIRGSRQLKTIDKPADTDGDSIVDILSTFRNILNTLYVRIVMLFAFLWLIIFVV